MTKRKKPYDLHPILYRSGFFETFRTLWNGSSPKLDGKKVITGILKPATKSKVTKRINELLANSKEIKIGVMGDTLVRMDGKDYRKSYDFVSRV